MTQPALRMILTVVTLLIAVTPASAGWILYRQESGLWRASGVYQDLTACEAEAKAMAEKLKVLVGCAPPSAATTVQPPTAVERSQVPVTTTTTGKGWDKNGECGAGRSCSVTVERSDGASATISRDCKRVFNKQTMRSAVECSTTESIR